MSNTLVANRRLLAAALGGLVALPSSGVMVAISMTGPGPGLMAFAITAPVVGAAMGLLLGRGVRPAPAPYPGIRAAITGLLAVPVGSLMIAVLLNGPWWTTHPLTALFQSVLYGLAGTMVYGWLVLPLTVPSAVVGAFLLQRLLARLGAADGSRPSDLQDRAS